MRIFIAVVVFLWIPGALSADVPSDVRNSRETAAYSPSPEWVNYTNGDKVTDIADDGDFLWIGTQGGGIVKLNKLTDELTFYDRANAGLPDNHIATVETDTAGNLWIGSLNSGIGMFNGNTCTVYNSENSGLPYDVWNQAIETDADGNVWIGSLYDVSEFDGADWTSFRIGNLASSNFWIADMEFDAQGDAWIGTSLGLYRLRGDELIVYDDVNRGVNAIETDSDGNLWIGTERGGLFRYDGEEWTVFDTENSEIPSNSVYSIASDSEGNLWLGTWKGLVKFSGKDWQVFDSDNSGLPEDSVLSVEIDENDNIWCGLFHNGLVKYDGTGWKHYDTTNSVFPSNFVYSVETDHQGNIWFGVTEGVVRFDGKNWTVYDSEDFGLTYVNTTSIETDADGNLWMRTKDQELRHNHLVKYDGERWTEIASPLPKVQPWFIRTDSQGILWFGSGLNGVFRFDGTSWTNYNTDNSPLPGNYIRDIAFDSHGNVWIGSDKGLVRFDRKENWTLYNTDNSEIPYDTFATLEFDSEDVLWLGGGGLTRFDGTSWTSYNRDNSGISSNRIMDICEDDEGNLWLGTSPGGLVKYDRKDEWKVYDQSNSGIARDNVYAVTVDSHGNKWMGHNLSGLSVFREGGIVFTDKDSVTYHSADHDSLKFNISLSELLRVIQIYTTGEYHCASGTEDGYTPGKGGNQTCRPHDSDYSPQDWRIGLNELLRTIQFYNSAGYHTDMNSEDGFAPGKLSR